ncbi:hypothetical protein Leryth_013037 [Lithospermum erythrorhizon]|nr:hypothetical protein Leryth_013037 [Lithospermum erythrorhizon]
MPYLLMKISIIVVSVLVLCSFKSDAQYEDYCIADEQVPDGELQAALKWACENGADCRLIQPGQPCFTPDNVKDHASFAFNSYYQNMKHKGGSCYFNSAALLTAANPSHDGCKYEYID